MSPDLKNQRKISFQGVSVLAIDAAIIKPIDQFAFEKADKIYDGGKSHLASLDKYITKFIRFIWSE